MHRWIIVKNDITVGRQLWFRNKPFTTKSGEEFISEEKYYLVKIPDTNVSFVNMTDVEKKLTKEGKWWSEEELKASTEEFFTDKLHERLLKVLDGNSDCKPEEI